MNTPRTDAAVRLITEEIHAPAVGWKGQRQMAVVDADVARQLERKLARYEQAFGNIETIIDGKAEASVEEGRYQSNDYGQIQSAIDEARR